MEESPPPVPAQVRNISVGAILFGIGAGIIGLALGLLLGIAIGAGLAAALNVSAREGAAGYFAVGIALIVAVLVTPASILFTLYRRGVRRIWLLIGLIVVCISMAGIGAGGFGLCYMAQPHILNPNAATPLLEFEVKPPDGQSVQLLAEVEPELNTDRNTMPGYWHDDAPENPGVRAGYVEVYFRTSRRIFVLKFPGNEDRIFNLKLPANPLKEKYRAWSDWQKPDYIAKGSEQPSRPTGTDDCQIRYRMEYQAR